MASLTNKEIAALHKECMRELREGGNEATQKMLEFLGIESPLKTDEFYHRVQLMLAQEEYYEMFLHGNSQILKRDDDDIGYRLGQYKDDFKTYVDQLVQELTRKTVSQDVINNDLARYNDLLNQANAKQMEIVSPTSGTAKEIKADSYWLKPPYIYHFVSGDFESGRLERETQAKYAERTDAYFRGILIGAMSNSVPLIHITPEQAVNICRTPSEETLKHKEELKKKLETSKQVKEENKPAPVPEKPKSKLAQFLERFASFGSPVAETKLQEQQNVEVTQIKSEKAVEKINKKAQPAKTPIGIGQIKVGMEIVIPADCKNVFDGQKLPEMKAKVLSVWQAGGQMMISTTAGVLTTRDMKPDLHQELQEKIQKLEYEIEHAAEIAAERAAEMERINYKLNWFGRVESSIPTLPRDDRLDMDDMSYFGYTPESYSIAAEERSRDYHNGMDRFRQESQIFARELVQRCLNENIRMIYAGEYWTNFEYYGPTPDDFSPPDFSYNAVPQKYEDEVYLPSTCTDALTGEKLEHNANKMKDIWDIVASGGSANSSFALVGENVNGEVILVTSIDIRDVAREMTRNLSIEPQETELENDGQEELDIGDKR